MQCGMIRQTLTALAALALPATLHAQQAIDPEQLADTVRTMTDDLFEGRAPGTVGEERTIGYLVARFRALGLEPGGPDGNWLQPVRLLHTRLGTPRRLEVSAPGGAIPSC